MSTNRNRSVAALLAVVSLVCASASADWVDMGISNGDFSTPGTFGALGQAVTISANSGTSDMDTTPASPTFGQSKLFQDWRALGAATSGTAYSTSTGEARLYKGAQVGKNETPLLVHDAMKKPDGTFWTIESKVYKLEFDTWASTYSYKPYASFYYGDTDTSSAATWKGGSYFNFPTPSVWYPTAETQFRSAWADPLPNPCPAVRVTLYWDNTGSTTSTPWGEGPMPANTAIVYTGLVASAGPPETTGNQRLGQHLRVGFVGSQNGTSTSTNLYIDNVVVSYFDDAPPAPDWHPGDANKDGAVDLQDFGLLKENFGATENAIWDQGDFNADAGIDLQDFGILKDHFGHTTGDTPVTAVPEPASMLLLAAGAAFLRKRRTR